MRPGGRPGAADPADELSLRDMRAGADAGAERRQVQVVGLESAGVLQPHLVAAGAGVAPPTRRRRAATATTEDPVGAP